MRVIFLDIDGVMNSRVFYEKRHKNRWFKLSHWLSLPGYWFRVTKRKLGLNKPTSLKDHKTPDSFYTFENQFKRLKYETCPQKWEWLSNWCNQTNTKICVSSVWKHHFGVKGYKSTPERWEDAFQLLGFNPGTYVGITGDRKTLRGQEIQGWLDKHPEVENYAILDDDSDMLPEQFCKFHHCDPWFGLNPNHLYRIKRQFNDNANYEYLSQIINDDAKLSNDIIDDKFKSLFYDLGEINFDVLKTEAWQQYINEDKKFNQKQLETFRYWLENLVSTIKK